MFPPPQPSPPSPFQQSQVWLAVGEDGFCVLDGAMVSEQQRSDLRVKLDRTASPVKPSAPPSDPQHTLASYSYLSVITFGGCRDDFMVVTTQRAEPGGGKKIAEKLVFAMPKPKVGHPHPHLYPNPVLNQQPLLCFIVSTIRFHLFKTLEPAEQRET